MAFLLFLRTGVKKGMSGISLLPNGPKRMK